MPLPIFNLQLVIKKYNIQDDKNKGDFQKTYHREETFDFEDFKDLKHRHRRIQAVNESYDLYVYSKEEAAYNRKRLIPISKHQIDRLRQVGQKTTVTTHTPVIERNPLLEASIERKRRHYHWQAMCYDHLVAFDWVAAKTTVKVVDQRRLKEIKKSWESAATFSRCTNEALVFLSEQLSTLLHEARTLKTSLTEKSKELKAIPPYIKEAYANHLTDFITEAETHTEQLAANMLARLQAWDATGGKSSNTLMLLHTQLKSIEIDTPEPPLKNDPYTLTVDQFLLFHRTIETYGSRETKQQLKQLSWFHIEAALPVRSLETKEGQFLVPASLEEYVPLQRPYLPWLFRGEALRYDYFKAKTLSLASLRKISGGNLEDRTPMTYSQGDAELKTIQYQENTIRGLIEELSHPPYSDISFLFFETRECFRKWNSELKIYQGSLLEKKIQVAERMIQSITIDCEKWRQDSEGLHLTGIPIDWNTCTQVELLLIELSVNCLSMGVDHPFLKRIETLQKTFDNLRALNRCFDILQTLSQGNAIKEEDKTYLFQFYLQEQTRNLEAAHAFQAYCRPRLEKVMTHFEHHLKQRPNTNDSIQHVESQVEALINYHDIIRQLGDDTQKRHASDRLKKKLPYFLLRYLETLVRVQQQPDLQKEQPPLLDQLEKLFFAVGHEVWQGESNYHQLITLLQQYRRNKQWDDIEAKGGALIQSIGKKLLIQRLDKDCKTLDSALFTCTEQDKAVGYSEMELQHLKDVRDKKVPLLKTGVVSPTERRCLLPLLPRVPLDETHPSVKPRSQFFGFSIRAHQDLQKIRQESNYGRCVSTARLLGKQFATLSTPNDYSAVNREAKKANLFSKTYMDPDVEKIIIANG